LCFSDATEWVALGKIEGCCLGMADNPAQGLILLLVLLIQFPGDAEELVCLLMLSSFLGRVDGISELYQDLGMDPVEGLLVLE
jgi:hypothetical protein